MKKRRMKQIFAILFTFLLIFPNAMYGTSAQANAEQNLQLEKMVSKEKSPVNVEDYDPDEMVRVIVELQGEAAIEHATDQGILYKQLPLSKKKSLEASIDKEQSAFLAKAKEKNLSFTIENSFNTVINGVSGQIQADKISELEMLPDVAGVYIANEYQRPDVKPDMNTSKDMIGTSQTWINGYNGKGMVVGVIDTGIDYTHKDMTLTADPKRKLTEASVNSVIASESLLGKYYSLKVPYGYNYFDKNNEVRDLGPGASMHGMHVAGTVAANGNEATGGITGVAPEAQLLALKVFSNDEGMPSTWGDIYIKAIDDGIKLGADVLNMSLGSTASFVNENDPEQRAVQRATDNGVFMSISAGNSAQFGYGYTNNPLASNPDIGLVGAPSLSRNSLSVASIENTKITLEEMAVTIGSETLMMAYKTQEAPRPVDVFGTTNKLDVISVGDGSPAQYTGKDVKGKVVLVVRTSTGPNYGAIQAAAEAAGAAGIIVGPLVAHGDYVSMALNAPTIPMISLSISDGNLLQSKLAASAGKVNFTGKQKVVVNGFAGLMATTTSWGVTPNLDFKPEITAPGGQIYSTLNENKYGVMSGTSMAAPHVSGGSALVLQRVQQLFSGLTGVDKVKRAKTLMMNTSKPATEGTGSAELPYSPRRQGAGLMDLHAATTTPVYVVNKGTNDGKIALKEIDTDSFTMTVTATNFSEDDVTYNVSANVLTDATTGAGATRRNALKEQSISNAAITYDASTVTIPAGKTKDITVTVDLTAAKAPMEASFPNGYFVEGFITLTDAKADPTLPKLTVPYVGFKGDWNKAPILDPMRYDSGFYYGGISGMVDKDTNYIGYNAFTGAPNKNFIAISPNGDGMNDEIAPVLSYLRNSKTTEYSITDTSGKMLRKLRTQGEERKDYYAGGHYTYRPNYTTWDGLLNNQLAPEGKYFYQIKTQVDYAGKDAQTMQVPVMVDVTKPIITDLTFDKSSSKLSLKATDNVSGLAYLEIYINDTYQGALNPVGALTYTVPGLSLAISEGATIKVIAADYAGNESSTFVYGAGDSTIPYIVADSPEALGGYDTRTVPVSGYVMDASVMKYLRVKGDTLQGSPVELTLVKTATNKYTFSGELTFTSDDVHTISFEGEDGAGNKISFLRQVIVDTEAPTISVKGVSASNYVGLSEADPILHITVADNFDDIRLLVNGSEEYKHDFDEPYVKRALSHTLDYQTSLKQGKNEIEMLAEDIMGHVTKHTVTIYKGVTPPVPNPGGGGNPPPPPVVLPSAPIFDQVDSEMNQFTGKADPGTTVTVTNKGAFTVSGITNASGRFTIPFTGKLTAGRTLYASAKDSANRVSAETLLVVIDKTAPSSPKVNPITSEVSRITGKAEPGSSVTVTDKGKFTISGKTDNKGDFTLTFKGKLTAGRSLYATATDDAGNVSKETKFVVIDKTPPTAPKVNPVKSSATKVTGKAEPGSSVSVKIGSKQIGSATAGKDGKFSVTISKQQAGQTLTVTATDHAGNVSNATSVKVKK